MCVALLGLILLASAAGCLPTHVPITGREKASFLSPRYLTSWTRDPKKAETEILIEY